MNTPWRRDLRTSHPTKPPSMNSNTSEPPPFPPFPTFPSKYLSIFTYLQMERDRNYRREILQSHDAICKRKSMNTVSDTRRSATLYIHLQPIPRSCLTPFCFCFLFCNYSCMYEYFGGSAATMYNKGNNTLQVSESWCLMILAAIQAPHSAIQCPVGPV